MRDRSSADEAHVRRKRHVAREPLPREEARVFGGPDVGAASSDLVLAGGGVEFQAAGLGRDPEIALDIEQIALRRLGRGQSRRAKEDETSHLRSLSSSRAAWSGSRWPR